MILVSYYRKIRYFIAKRKWIRMGRPMVKYSQFWCGCCGKVWKIPFEIPEFESCGEWCDTWGVCPKGQGCKSNKGRGKGKRDARHEK